MLPPRSPLLAPRTLAVAVLVSAAAAGCQHVDPSAMKPSARAFPIGTVLVDPDSRCVFATGFVNQVEGPIELLACGPGGKRHESVLVMKVNPVDLQTGLLLLGIKTSDGVRGLGEGPPKGTPVEVLVAWKQDGRERTARAEEFLFSRLKKAPVRKAPWVFTGSLVQDGRFMAIEEESLIATYWDPWAIINIGDASGGDDEAFSVNADAVPALDTAVQIRIRPAGRPPR
jgi:hypothetical protein